MRKININKATGVSGGVPFIQVGYAILGCAIKVGISYKNDPELTQEEAMSSCAGGVVHSMNPAFGVTSRLFANPLTRYAAGLLWSDLASKSEKKCTEYLEGSFEQSENLQ